MSLVSGMADKRRAEPGVSRTLHETEEENNMKANLRMTSWRVGGLSLILLFALLLGACASQDNDSEATTAPGTAEGTLVAKSSTLAGTDVLSTDGDDVGEVSHALVDAQGNIRFVVFDVGGFLGVGERVVAVPWGSFQVVPDENRPHLVYNGTQADLEALPEMDDVDLGGGRIDANGTDYNGLVALGQTITDFNVVGASGEDLGEVEDVILDLSTGQARYGLVDFGGFLGLAEHTVAVPWQRMALQAGEDGEPNDTVFQLNVNEDTLRNAPEFDDDNLKTWPDPANPDWDTDIRNFWQTVA
jgi:sporulation protein YlmC with PRC-barrel domain